MVEMEARIKDKTPFVVVALQEAGRMNGLLVEMKRRCEGVGEGVRVRVWVGAGALRWWPCKRPAV